MKRPSIGTPKVSPTRHPRTACVTPTPSKTAPVYFSAFYCLDYAAAGFALDTWFQRNTGIDQNSDGRESGVAVDLDGDNHDSEACGARARVSENRCHTNSSEGEPTRWIWDTPCET